MPPLTQVRTVLFHAIWINQLGPRVQNYMAWLSSSWYEFAWGTSYGLEGFGSEVRMSSPLILLLTGLTMGVGLHFRTVEETSFAYWRNPKQPLGASRDKLPLIAGVSPFMNPLAMEPMPFNLCLSPLGFNPCIFSTKFPLSAPFFNPKSVSEVGVVRSLGGLR